MKNRSRDLPDLVLDLPLLPARSRRAGDRLDEVMPGHLQEAPIVGPLLADEDRLHRGLHVVVDAARAGAPEEGEGPVVSVEHHLLALARIGTNEHHSTVTEPDVRHLHRHRKAVHQDDLVAPVELVGLARCEGERHVGVDLGRRRLQCPDPRIATNGVVAAFVTPAAKLLEQPNQRQPLSRRRRRVRREQPVQLALPRSELRQRLALPTVGEGRLAGTQHLPDRVPGDVQFAGDLLDRTTPNEELAAYPRNRIH